ncbi:hypothetical protein D3C87_601120 [compost metagenome]
MFALFWKVDYEGESLIGVFEKEEDAERVGEFVALEDDPDRGNCKYVPSSDYSKPGYVVRSFELNTAYDWWNDLETKLKLQP